MTVNGPERRSACSRFLLVAFRPFRLFRNAVGSCPQTSAHTAFRLLTRSTLTTGQMHTVVAISLTVSSSYFIFAFLSSDSSLKTHRHCIACDYSAFVFSTPWTLQLSLCFLAKEQTTERPCTVQVGTEHCR